MVAEPGAGAAAMEAAVAAMQQELQTLKGTLAAYEKTVKEEITSVAGGLRDLYGKADIAIASLELRAKKPGTAEDRRDGQPHVVECQGHETQCVEKG